MYNVYPATNNVAEIRAVIRALEIVKKYGNLQIIILNGLSFNIFLMNQVCVDSRFTRIQCT